MYVARSVVDIGADEVAVFTADIGVDEVAIYC